MHVNRKKIGVDQVASSNARLGVRRRRWSRGLVLTTALVLIVAAGIGGWKWVGRIDTAIFTTSVSGVAAPSGDLPGWRQTFVDDFEGAALSDSWGTYDGVPSGDPVSRWKREHVQVRDSQLVLEGYQEDGQWITGGVSNHPVAQTFGRWDVRFRMDASDEITVAFLLWPQGGQWPPEIDFMEDDGGLRGQASGFVHYVDAGGRGKVQRQVAADFTQWQTVGVEWSPGLVTFTLNDAPWGQVSGDVVPAQPMWLAMQAQSGGCERKAAYGGALCPVAGKPANANIYIDWVSVYAPE